MPKLHFIYFFLLLWLNGFSQGAFFNAAYQQNPNIPKGFLEAISYTHTRMVPIKTNEINGCNGMPLPYGIMGLFEDGFGYFIENGKRIATLSGISIQQQKSNPELEVIAFANACQQLIDEQLVEADSTAALIHALMWELTEIPHDGTINRFAFESTVYEVFKFLMDEEKAATYGFPLYTFNLKLFFGEQNFQVLSAAQIYIGLHGITTSNNIAFQVTTNLKSTNYGPALWTAAPSCNYSSRNATPISAVTIHTVQGTYAGAISWGLNCNAQVSYHYVVRSSDGQVTQMVLESYKAWHVGSENSYTIGIEHEGYVSNAAWYTPSLYQGSANLVKDITQSGYGISPLRTYDGAGSTATQLLGNCIRIKGHQHYANQSHTDPGVNWNWDAYYKLVNAAYTPILVTNNNGTLYDSGGATGNYGPDERKIWVIQGAIGTTITLHFTLFNVEASYDKLLIYDGSSVMATLLGCYSGNALPPTIQSSGNTLTLEFRSDCATQLNGWEATYSSTMPLTDIAPPTSQASYLGTWQTQSFNATFQDIDNQSGVKERFYNVSSRNNGLASFHSTTSTGFFRDEFHDAVSLWTNQSGVFQSNNGIFTMADASQNNSNAYAQVTQQSSQTYFYTWKQRFNTTFANQRAGMHFFCSDPTLSNRGNSYFVYFREETNKVQLYKVINDAFTLVKEDSIPIFCNQWDEAAVKYNPNSGSITVFYNQQSVLQWIDVNPLLQGSAISLRSGACSVSFDDIYVYKTHGNNELITVGIGQEINNQSDHQQASGCLRLVAIDSAGNWNIPMDQLIQVDWTPPALNQCYDGPGLDIDTVYQPVLEGNWYADDVHSGISYSEISIGTAGNTGSLVQGLNTGLSTQFMVSPTGISPGIIYYTTIVCSNQAGLSSNITTDGQLYMNQAQVDTQNPLDAVLLYPNPVTNGLLTIQHLSFPVELLVYDLQGKLVFNATQVMNGSIALPVNAGVYIIELQGQGFKLSKAILSN
jgi:N-acetyl-anhydromuramyl-L-alanine amidase AmpD